MDDELEQAYARLTAHEFLLEILYANWLAQMSEEAADDFRRQFVRGTKSAWVSEHVDPDDARERGSQIAMDASVMAERFWEKVLNRASSMRDA